MTRFRYRAAPLSASGAGAVRAGRLEATDERAARQSLRERGLVPLEVRPLGVADALRALTGERPLNLADRDWFFRTLARLMTSKAPLEQAVAEMADLAPKPKLAGAAREVLDRIRKGSPLGDACAASPGLTTAQHAALLRVGHESGRLERAVTLVARSIDSSRRLRRAVAGQMVYPAVLLVAGVLVIWILATFVIPRFAETLRSIGAELPASTSFTLAAARTMVWLGPVLVLAVAGAAVYARVAGLSVSWKRRASRLALRVPLVRDVYWNAKASVAADTIATMLEGGGDVLSAIELASDAVGEGEVADRLQAVRRDVREGGDVGRALSDRRVLPPVVATIVRVGARSGDLEGALRSAAQDCFERQAALVERLLTLLSPAVILLMAGLVGWVFYSLIAGMLAINDAGGL